MKKTRFIAAALVAAPVIAFAKPMVQPSMVFDGPVQVVKVAELLQDSSMFSEKEVVVEGQLVRQLNKDTFIFSDGSAEIQVELDDDIHVNQTINTTTRLRLFGEYEGGNKPEIEVDHLTVL